MHESDEDRQFLYGSRERAALVVLVVTMKISNDNVL